MTKVRSLTLPTLALFGATLFATFGCNGTETNPNLPPGVTDGSVLVPGTPNTPSNPSNPTPEPSPTPTPDNPNLITVAVKYVALQSAATSAPTPSQADVAAAMASVSKMWAQCDIELAVEEYLSPAASDHGLDYTPANHTDLNAMRSEFDDGRHALFVKTGTWDRSGTLGYDGSNGFSTMPGSNPEGIVVESGVATSYRLLAHEAGHLIGGLGHTTSTTNLMNHYVTTSTTLLSASQCDSARAILWDYHAQWIR